MGRGIRSVCDRRARRNIARPPGWRAPSSASTRRRQHRPVGGEERARGCGRLAGKAFHRVADDAGLARAGVRVERDEDREEKRGNAGRGQAFLQLRVADLDQLDRLARDLAGERRDLGGRERPRPRDVEPRAFARTGDERGGGPARGALARDAGVASLARRAEPFSPGDRARDRARLNVSFLTIPAV